MIQHSNLHHLVPHPAIASSTVMQKETSTTSTNIDKYHETISSQQFHDDINHMQRNALLASADAEEGAASFIGELESKAQKLRAKMNAATLTSPPRSHPTRGIHFNRAMIGENKP